MPTKTLVIVSCVVSFIVLIAIISHFVLRKLLSRNSSTNDEENMDEIFRAENPNSINQKPVGVNLNNNNNKFVNLLEEREPKSVEDTLKVDARTLKSSFTQLKAGETNKSDLDASNIEDLGVGSVETSSSDEDPEFHRNQLRNNFELKNKIVAFQSSLASESSLGVSDDEELSTTVNNSVSLAESCSALESTVASFSVADESMRPARGYVSSPYVKGEDLNSLDTGTVSSDSEKDAAVKGQLESETLPGSSCTVERLNETEVSFFKN